VANEAQSAECRGNLPPDSFSRLGPVPRVAPTLLALALGAGVSLALASCGGSDAKLLPGQTAREITANLNTVNQLAGEGDCLGAESAARQVSEQVESLNGVATKLKQALSEGAERLNEVVARCEEPTTEAVAPNPAPPEPTQKPKKEEKEEEKEKKPKEEKAPPPEHELPPQSNGKGKGLEKEPPAEEEEPEPGPPSGGVGPGSPVGEGD
jgi:outer membrane biosynthesis protein TonB